MKNTKIKPYFIVEKDGVLGFYTSMTNATVMLDTDDIEKYGGVSKKQLDLYLFRHPEILKAKFKKKKLVSIDILEYVFKNTQRIASKNQ